MPIPLPTPEQRLAHRTQPSAPHVMHQEWRDLLFLHWRFDPALIQRTLPAGLYVDTFAGCAWVAIVPFLMRGIRPRFSPAVPALSDFLEINVRTYVHDAHGRSGVWFYSLDCNQPVAVWTARTLFSLPYQHARMTATRQADGALDYHCARLGQPQGSHFTYALSGESRTAAPETLEFFLAERYLLFARTRAGLRTGQVHHAPYPLVAAAVRHWDARLIGLAGLPTPDRNPDHIIGSPGVRVRVYGLTP